MALRRLGDVIEQRSTTLGTVAVHDDPQQPTLAGRHHVDVLQLEAEVLQDRGQQRTQLVVFHTSSVAHDPIVSSSCVSRAVERFRRFSHARPQRPAMGARSAGVVGGVLGPDLAAPVQQVGPQRLESLRIDVGDQVVLLVRGRRPGRTPRRAGCRSGARTSWCRRSAPDTGCRTGRRPAPGGRGRRRTASPRASVRRSADSPATPRSWRERSSWSPGAAPSGHAGQRGRRPGTGP